MRIIFCGRKIFSSKNTLLIFMHFRLLILLIRSFSGMEKPKKKKRQRTNEKMKKKNIVVTNYVLCDETEQNGTERGMMVNKQISSRAIQTALAKPSDFVDFDIIYEWRFSLICYIRKISNDICNRCTASSKS